MTTGVITDRFAYGHATAPKWRAAVEACVSQCGVGAQSASLGFVYATDAFADHFAEIVDELRARTGIAKWVGTIGVGVCATGREYLDEPALAVMCCSFDESSFRVLPTLSSPREVSQRRFDWGNHRASFAVLHADASNRSLTSLVREIAGRTETGFVVGGLTSSRGRSLQYADGVSEGGVSGVLFSEEVIVATRLTQGCSPLGPRHRVTESQQNVLIRLDDRPALDVLREDLGPNLWANLAGLGGYIFAGLVVEGSDVDDYVVRNLVGLDRAGKMVAISDAVKPGQRMLFCRRDRGTASDDLMRMLDSIKTGLYRVPRGALYFSCLGRGASLFGDNSEELRIIAEALDEVPLIGFFGNGEISHNRLYGYTGVLTLFL
ncbi:MAG TPA: FIST N-terminal domain-containing protein [Burkholderiales bacterium]|nr:FIST N-terminal domain-containing protein [Burkholderiales bacterium]